jgi:hypothetical protein
MKSLNLIKRAAVVAIMASFAGVTLNAAMVPYTGTTPLQNDQSHPTTAGVVGTIGGTTGQGQGGWGTFQQTAAQTLLNLSLGGSGTSGGVPVYANTVHDYSGIVIGSSLSGSGQTVPEGWEFVIAKYAGQQAGYVVFYLGGNSATIPSSPQNYWTTQTGKYGLSGWTAFNAVPEPTTLIAGALLLLPFGASTLRSLRRTRAN